MPPATPPAVCSTDEFFQELGPGGRAILDIAETVFAEKGFDATSMSEVARLAGVSKANIFHHFGSKRGLYLAVIRAACRDTREALQQTRGSGESVADRLAAFQRHHIQTMFKRSRVTHLIIREVMEATPERARELTEEVFSEGFEQLVETIRSGQESGEFRSELDPALIAQMIIAADVFFFQNQEVLRHFPRVTYADAPERYAAMVTELLLNGCRVCEGKPPASDEDD